MKRDASWVTAIAVVAATTFGLSSLQSKSGGDSTPAAKLAMPATPVVVAKKDSFKKEICGDLEKQLQHFLDLPAKELAAPPSCFNKDQLQPKPSQKLLDAAGDLRFIIATLPDPVHTHLSLDFDRDAEAIQQAAQDEGFSYDSSWLPWDTDKPEYQLLLDQDVMDERQDRREDQPGILLFRKTNQGLEDNHLYDRGLVVFVVGEDPTAGIHRGQFRHAVEWIKAIQPKRPTDNAIPGVKILGPSFSGSLPSLAQILQGTDVSEFLHDEAPDGLEIYSGHVTSHPAFTWFRDRAQKLNLNIQFHSFQQDDDIAMQHYCTFLVKAGLDTDRLAIISEDETEYGSIQNGRKDDKDGKDILTSGSKQNDLCKPDKPDLPWRFPGAVSLYYPRDISALRAAYQQQSIFSRYNPQNSGATARHTLATDLAESQDKQDDTIQSYGASRTALSEEAVLLQIVDTLRAHQSQFLLLRSTNPLDQIFLAQFFKLTYPEGRIYILGDDLLLRREVGPGGLDGIMTLSTYPLVPEVGDWTKPYGIRTDDGADLNHSHRAFENVSAEASYIAVRFLLLTGPEEDPVKHEKSDWQPFGFLPSNCDPALHGYNLPEYSEPFWLMQPPKNGPPLCEKPLTWISVLGSNRFWPVASLSDGPPQKPPTDIGRWLDAFARRTAPQSAKKWSRIPTHRAFLRYIQTTTRWIFIDAPKTVGLSLFTIARQMLGKPSIYTVNQFRLPAVPLSMSVCLLAVLLWAGFHAFCCIRPSITVKPDHRAYFVRLSKRWPQPTASRSHLVLILLASWFLVMICTTLAWGYGWMSPDGEPVSNPWIYSWIPILVWLIVGAGVAANAWVEYQLSVHKEVMLSPMTLFKHPWKVLRHTLKTIAKRSTQETPAITPASTQPQPERPAIKIGSSLIANDRQQSFEAAGSALFHYALLSSLFYLFMLLVLDSSLYPEIRVPTYFRSMNLTSGVSPVIPLVLLALGMYGWAWYSLKGLSLLGGDRPLLPETDDLKTIITPGEPKSELLSMMSRERAADPMEELCQPFQRQTWLTALIIFALIWIAAIVISNGAPLRSLGTQRYSRTVCIWMAISISILLANAWQLVQLWLKLRALLVFLDKLPLRRTFQAMRGFTWGSIWKIGTNVLELRYKLFYRQFESLVHLQASFETPPPTTTKLPPLDRNQWILRIKNTRIGIRQFAAWYSDNWDDWEARDLSKLEHVQYLLAQLAGQALTDILIPAWNTEQESLIIVPSTPADAPDPEAAHMQDRVSRLDPRIRNAEETVCLVYLGVIQNMLGRIRSLVMGITWLFLSIALVVPSYPFDPRPVLTRALVILFVIVGVVIFHVYSQMFRDATLSHLTNTRPGELGMEFWLKFISFGVGPLFGLLATVFPEFSSFFFSWLQPSLSSIK